MSCFRGWLRWPAVAGIVLGAADAAAQQQSFWGTNSSGEFHNAANWTDGVPGESHIATFARGAAAAYSVSLPSGTATSVGEATIESNEVTFAPAGPLAEFRVVGLAVERPRGALYVGREQAGAVFHMDLPNFYAEAVIVGDVAGSHGTIEIREADALLWITGGEILGPTEFTLGRYGTGVLNVTGGWAYLISREGDADFGRYAGGSGTANITGRSANLSVGGLFRLGYAGRGALNVADGGLVQSSAASLLGFASGGVGEAQVTGAGTEWRNFSTLFVGYQGQGELDIADGGKVTSNQARMGYGPASRGAVTVAGAGSIWDVRYALQVGVEGVGELTVENQGRVEAALITIGKLGKITGSSFIDGPVKNEGMIAPDSEGAPLVLSKGYQQTADGQLLIELGSASQYSRLDIAGAVELAGALKVQVANSFVPAAGQAFDILDFTSVTGEFASLDLPSLSVGSSWDASELYTTGVLRIAGAPSADFNHDGKVDGDDLLDWQGDFGENDFSDADDDGDSDGADLLAWQRQLGSSAAAVSAVVPEPGCGVFLGLAAACWRRREICGS